MSEFTFMLFIDGDSPKSLKAKRNLKKICNNMNLDYDLITIDISTNPHIAESTKIVAIPMLMRTAPEPSRRFVGDFSDFDQDLLTIS